MKNNYLVSCLAFARESKEWMDLDEYKFYTTSENDYWRETPGNEHDGYDVSWAFKLTEDEITKKSSRELADMIKSEFEQAIDEEFDIEQIRALINKAHDALAVNGYVV